MTRLSKAERDRLAHEMLGCVADKWTLLVIDALDESGELRFTRLRAAVPGVSQKMLTKTLRKLERDGLVIRTVHPVIPPHVDYKLTQLGKSLGAAVCAVWEWVEHHVDEVERARRAFGARDPQAG